MYLDSYKTAALNLSNEFGIDDQGIFFQLLMVLG